MNQQNDKEPTKKLSLWQMIGSTLAAAMGVQSSKNRERDFQHGDVKKFVILGIVFTIIFLLVLMGVVKIVLSQVG